MILFSLRLGERLIVISAIHGLNPSGGFPSESVQFYHRDKIVIIGKAELSSAILGLKPSGGIPLESVQFGFPYQIVVADLASYSK